MFKLFQNSSTINTRVSIIFLLSVTTILIFTCIGIYSNYTIYKNMQQIKHTSKMATVIASLVHETQKERGFSAGYIGSNGKKFSKELMEQKKLTDKEIAKFNAYAKVLKIQIGAIDTKEINAIRQKIKRFKVTQDKAIEFYSNLNDKLLHFVIDIAQLSTDVDITKELMSYSNFLFLKELTGIERAVITNIFAKDYLRYKDKSIISDLMTKQNMHESVFLLYADKSAKNIYKKRFDIKAFDEVDFMRKVPLQINKINRFDIEPKYWFDTISIKINFLKDVDEFLSQKLIKNLYSLKENSKYNFISYFLISGFVIIFLLVLKYFISIGITKTLKDLDKKTYQLNKSIESFDKNVISSQTDTNGILTHVSEAFCNICGFNKKELIGQSHNIIRHPDMPKETFEQIWETIQSGNIWTGELKNRKKDGSYYWVEVILSPKVDKEKNLIGFNSISQEITNKKALEELSATLDQKVKSRTKELEKERHFIDTVLNSQEQMVLTTDGKSIRSANKAFMQFYGIKELKEFTDMYNCICDTFYKQAPEGYLQINIDGELWSRYVLNNPNISHKVMIERNRRKYIFGVTVVKVNVHDELLEIAVFNDITELENTKQEIERKVEEGLIEIKALNEEITNTQKEVVFTMGAITEARSKETSNHVKRVAEYSKLFALKYGIRHEEAELLKQASPMHDIGKIAIDDDILKKPGKLTHEEFETMKKHAEIGYDMLKSSKRAILKTASIVAHEHHEKYDGTGYPNKLKGEDIHIYGRITAIADVFDALGSDRVYKKAWGDEKIFKLFEEEKGKHFDPKLVDIFFDNLDEFLQIREYYKDTV